jgi:hypothetical protein
MKDLTEESKKAAPERRPDELGGMYVQGHIKIFDPESGKIIVDKRG